MSPLSKLTAPHVNVTSVDSLGRPQPWRSCSISRAPSFLKEIGISAGYVVPEDFLEDNDANA